MSMVKRLFLVLPVLFVFSLLFVQVAKATETIEYTYTITKIGFYSSGTENPDEGTVIDLPSPIIIHQKINESNPNINDFIYQGNIANGTWSYIGVYITATTQPNFSPTPPTWGSITILGGPVTITDASRKLITISPRQHDGPAATITDL
jgi:hypothetical protein